MTMLYNPERLMLDVLAEVTEPPPPIDYLAWAKANIRFSEMESDFPGAYNESLFPFFTEILGALAPDDPCRFVTLSKSAQVGGTVLANIFTLGTLDLAPCLFLYVHPTDENGDRWSKQKLAPMIRASKHLQTLFPDRTRDGGSSIRYKERLDGRGAIQVAGANSPANLSQMTCPKQVQDDLAKWEDNSAGDPEDQAESRAKARSQAKIFKISTPLISPGCRITRAFNDGSQERYHVPCPHCGTFQSLEWESMRDHIDPETPEETHFRCVACAGRIEQRHRAWMVDPANGAGWVAKHPERRKWHRSFHIWMAYSPLEDWSAIARGWGKVQRGAAEDADQAGRRSIEQTFYNDSLGLPMVFDQAAVDWEVLRDRAEANPRRKGIVPDRALVLCLGIDVQETWIEWTLWGFGEFAYSTPIDHGRFDGRTGRLGPGAREHTGHISEPEIKAALDALIARRWRDESGLGRPIDITGIDGNYSTNDVYEWAKKHPRSKVIMLRGGNQDNAPLLLQVSYETDKRGKKKRRPYANRFFTFNASEFKMRLMRHLKKTDPVRPGFVDLPSGMGDDFWQQLVSETRVMKRINGRVRWQWDLPAGKRNEVLDNANQARGAMVRLGVNRWGEDEWAARRDAVSALAPLDADLEDLMMAGAGQPVPAKPASPAAKPSVAEALARARRARTGSQA